MLRKADKRLFRHRANVLAACAGALVLAALPALAALSSTPDATWGVLGPPGTDGVPKHPRVYSTLRVGETVFVGGDFAQAVPPQRSGGSAVPRADLAAIDAVT